MKNNLLGFIGFIFTFLIFYWIGMQINKKENTKNFIITHERNIVTEKTGDNKLYVIKFNRGYYTDMTIRMNSDSSYTIVKWGDRDSWMWGFKLDYHFDVDIPYDRSKGKDVSMDVELINIIKAIK